MKCRTSNPNIKFRVQPKKYAIPNLIKFLVKDRNSETQLQKINKRPNVQL